MIGHGGMSDKRREAMRKRLAAHFIEKQAYNEGFRAGANATRKEVLDILDSDIQQLTKSGLYDEAKRIQLLKDKIQGE